MGKYFGTDGFRGEAGVNLTVEHAFRVGRFLGYYYGKDHKAKVVIGKDTRRSGDMLEYALTAGLTASGADVYQLHVTPTPSVAYVVRQDGFDCGIMITASHNPFYDNGIKVINGKGYKLEAEIELEIEDYIDGKIDEVPYARRENIGKIVDYVEGRQRYIEYLTGLVGCSFEGVKVGLDLANGSATPIAKAVFDAVKEGDELAIEVAEQFGEYLGKGLAIVAATVGPEVFVIGGGVSKAGKILIDYIKPVFKKYAFSVCRETKFVLATLGNDAGIYGAAALILNNNN